MRDRRLRRESRLESTPLAAHLPVEPPAALLARGGRVFLPVPADESELIAESASELTYGWGAIPVEATIGGTTFTTSLFPRDGLYLLPLKVAVQRTEGLGIGDTMTVRMRLGR